MSDKRRATLDVLAKIMNLVESPWTQKEALRKTFSPVMALRMVPQLRTLTDQLEAAAKAWNHET